MAELDILGMTVPPEYGGSGADVVSWCIAQEELARGSAVVSDAQLLCKLMCDMLLTNASEAQKQRHPLMVRGKICCIAQTEPGAGSDVAGVQTTARRLPTEAGSSMAPSASSPRPSSATWPWWWPPPTSGKGRDRIALFLVEMGAPGSRAGQGAPPRDARARDGELVFDDCRVPASALVPPGAGFKRAMVSLDSGRIGIGAQALGIAQAAMDAAIRYARSARPSASRSPVSRRSSSCWPTCRPPSRARLLLRRAAFLKDQGAPSSVRPPRRSWWPPRWSTGSSPTPCRSTAPRLLDGVSVERLYRDARVPDLGGRARSSAS